MRKLITLLLLLASMAKAQTNIVKIEYWIDTDPGFDNAISVTGFTLQPDVKFNFIIPVNLTLGIHTFGIRSKDANNNWSQTNFFPISIADSSHGAIVQVEYFWDTDPTFGNATDSILSLPIVDINNGLFIDSVPMSFLVGSTSHILFERSKDSRGRWSHTNYVDSTVVTGTVNVNELDKLSGIKVYPNPFMSALTIIPKTNESVRLILYDGKGKKVLDTFINQETRINTQSLSTGSYILFVWTDKQIIYRTTIIKQ
ncbi:MAG: T9SS type A sorting domain-containing protein [Bacteroidia bacterium]|nr:T9SS type A sorting domain-containing protein [Bacteroidia bacterium]MCZ2278117.1 T9SS type A sorting domain-containing protein [Bacteroidia bacterium]